MKGWQIFGVGVLWGRGWFLAYVAKTVLLGRPTAFIKCIRISKMSNCNSKQCHPKLKVYFGFWNVQVGLIYSHFTFSNWIKSCHFHNIDPFNNRNPPVSPNELNIFKLSDNIRPNNNFDLLTRQERIRCLMYLGIPRDVIHIYSPQTTFGQRGMREQCSWSLYSNCSDKITDTVFIMVSGTHCCLDWLLEFPSDPAPTNTHYGANQFPISHFTARVTFWVTS